VKAAKNKGFTLVEMMVVVALITILISVAIPSLLSQRPLWRVNGAAREILTDMRLTQSKAIRAGDPHSIVFFSPLKKYEVFVDDGAGGGTAGDGIRGGGEILIKTVTLGNDVAFGTIGSPPSLIGGPIAADGINFSLRAGGKSVIFNPDGSAESGSLYLYPENATTHNDWQRAVEVVGNTGRVKIYSFDTSTSGWE
jgi:type IV fimbrial biogenesis protein FimT